MEVEVEVPKSAGATKRIEELAEVLNYLPARRDIPRHRPRSTCPPGTLRKASGVR